MERPTTTPDSPTAERASFRSRRLPQATPVLALPALAAFGAAAALVVLALLGS